MQCEIQVVNKVLEPKEIPHHFLNENSHDLELKSLWHHQLLVLLQTILRPNGMVQANFFQKQLFHGADTPIFGHLSKLFQNKTSNIVL